MNASNRRAEFKIQIDAHQFELADAMRERMRGDLDALARLARTARDVAVGE